MLLNRVLLFLVICNSYVCAISADSLMFEEVYKRDDFSTRNEEKVNWRPADNKEAFPKYLTYSIGVFLYVLGAMTLSGAINASD